MNVHETIVFIHIYMPTHKHIHRYMYKYIYIYIYISTDILTRLPILIYGVHMNQKRGEEFLS